MKFHAHAAVGNAKGIFDCAYDFNNCGEIDGEPREIGSALTTLLESLTAEDCQTMQYGTGEFYLQLTIEPLETPAETPADAENAKFLHDLILGFRDESPRGVDASLAARYLTSILATRHDIVNVPNMLDKPATDRLTALGATEREIDHVFETADRAWVVVADEMAVVDLILDARDWVAQTMEQ